MATAFNSSLTIVTCALTPDVAGVEGLAAYPNPTSGALTVKWAGVADAAAQVRVPDRQGRLTATPCAGRRSVGLDRVGWHASASLANGVYFPQVVHGDRSSARRVVLHR